MPGKLDDHVRFSPTHGLTITHLGEQPTATPKGDQPRLRIEPSLFTSQSMITMLVLLGPEGDVEFEEEHNSVVVGAGTPPNQYTRDG